MRFRILFVLLLPLLVLAACRPEVTSDTANLTIELQSLPESPVVGESTLLVTVQDANGNPVNDASVSVVGNMNHAGMTPVLSEAEAGENGEYNLPFEFTMGGDWVITVEVTLADGTSTSRAFNVNGVSSDMGEMEMESTEESHDMASMNMGGVSGAYLSITNNGESDVTLVSVSAEGVGMAQIHQTIVENDVARMEEAEGGLLIPAGETVELVPGGYHIMLMQLETTLLEGETISLTLSFDNGDEVTVDAMISGIAPETSETVEVGGLSINGAWARPTGVAEENGE